MQETEQTSKIIPRWLLLRSLKQHIETATENGDTKWGRQLATVLERHYLGLREEFGGRGLLDPPEATKRPGKTKQPVTRAERPPPPPKPPEPMGVCMSCNPKQPLFLSFRPDGTCARCHQALTVTEGIEYVDNG
jgi:hypothetical protein